MKQIQKNIGAVLMAMFLFATLSLPAFAASPSGFATAAILPENQIDSSLSYFDLLMEPGMKQTIQVAVSNSEDKPILVQLAANTATTSQDGLIDYTSPNEPDSSSKIFIEDITKVQQPEMRIEAGESKEFNIDIAMPESAFDGVLLGGLAISASYPEDVEIEENNSDAVVVENVFVHVIGLKLRVDEKPVKPDFQLVGVEAGMTNYRPDIKVQLQNAAPLVAKGMQVNLDVTKKDSEKVLYNSSFEDASMAPLSTGDFLVSMGTGTVQAGDYTVHASVTWEEETWTWTENFTIAGEKASQLNKESLAEPEEAPGLPLWLIITLVAGGAIIILLLVVVVVMLVKKKKPADK